MTKTQWLVPWWIPGEPLTYLNIDDVFMSYNLVTYEVPEYKLGGLKYWPSTNAGKKPWQTKMNQVSTFYLAMQPDLSRSEFMAIINGNDITNTYFNFATNIANQVSQPKQIVFPSNCPDGVLYITYLPKEYADKTQLRTIQAGTIQRIGALLHPEYIMEMRESVDLIFNELEIESRLWIGGSDNGSVGVARNLVPGITPIIRDHLLEINAALSDAEDTARSKGYTPIFPLTYLDPLTVLSNSIALYSYVETLRRNINIMESTLV